MASSRSSGRSQAGRLLGSETPRIFTPPLRELTPETSAGFALIEFAEIIGVTLLPWQKWLAVHALELLPDGTFRFRTVIVLVARQNGKSTFAQVLSLFFMYVRQAALVIGTAQNLDIAEEVWQGAVDIAQDVPDLAAEVDRVVRVNGKKSLELRTGERYKVQAASRRGGRGLSGDLVLMDELREHQTWDAWGAVTKTTMARPMAQIWALSNAGDATSIVLRYLRLTAHAALGDPDGINAEADPSKLLDETQEEQQAEVDESLGIFEWSAPANCDLMDPAGWAAANPSLGHTITERALSSSAKTDPEWVFRTECLCQWTDGTLEGPFPPGTWDAGKVGRDSQIVDDPIPCVEVSWDRSHGGIVYAGHRADGKPQVEVVAYRVGTDWMPGWLTSPDRTYRPKQVIIRRGSPAASAMQAYVDAGLEVIEWNGTEVSRACGAFYDAVRGSAESDEPCGELRHTGHSVLDVAAATAVTRPFGDTWSFDAAKSPTDISLLNAAVGALWGLQHPPEKPFRSRYEDDNAGLVFI